MNLNFSPGRSVPTAAIGTQILKGQMPSSLNWRLANRLVYKKVKQAFGGKVRDYLSGGASFRYGYRRLVRRRRHSHLRRLWPHAKPAPVLALNNSRDHRIGSVGKPIEIDGMPLRGRRRVADKDALKCFAGYWHKPEATAEAIEPTAGSTPAISPARTRTDFSTSPTGRRS